MSSRLLEKRHSAGAQESVILLRLHPSMLAPHRFRVRFRFRFRCRHGDAILVSWLVVLLVGLPTVGAEWAAYADYQAAPVVVPPYLLDVTPDESDCNASGYLCNTSACVNGSDGAPRGLRVPLPEALGVLLLLGSIVFATIFGNCLVFLSVFTYRPLKNVPNFLIASLAVSDFAVAFLVMPFNIYDTLYQPWMLGHVVCEIFTTSDVFFCTSSILNLCAIAVDRYNAIHDPLNYAQKRTAQRMIITIIAVYAASGLISVPPLLGWKEEREHEHCALSDNMVYVIISALGSFYIPCFVMCFVYVNIFLVARRRLRQRAKHSATKGSPSKKLAAKPARGNSIWSIRKGKRTLAVSRSERERNNSLRLAETAETADTDNSKSGSSNENANANQPPPLSLSLPPPPLRQSAKDERKMSEESVSTPDETIRPSFSLSAPGLPPDADARNLDLDNGNAGNTRLKASANTNKDLQPAGPSFIKSFAAERQKISLSRERKAARTLAILGGTFLVSWLPFFTWYLLGPFCDGCRSLDRNWVNFLVWLGYANSATNPVLYTVFNADFRRAFQKLLHLPNDSHRRQLRNARKR